MSETATTEATDTIFVVCFEISGIVKIAAKSQEEASAIFDKLSQDELAAQGELVCYWPQRADQ